MHLFRSTKIIFVCLFSTLYLLCFNSYGQSPKGGVLEITGWLLNDDDEPLRKADVFVYDGSLRIVEETTNRRGRFTFDLPVDRNYVAVFTADGHATKRISFNTGLPNDFSGFNAFYFEFLVELFPKAPGVDYSLLETPYIEIAYLPETQEFFFEESKARHALAQVEQIKDQTYEMLDLIDDFNEVVSDADKHYANNDYDNAIKLYNEALSIFPDEEHPKNRLMDMLAYEEPVDTTEGYEDSDTLASEEDDVQAFKEFEDLLAYEDMRQNFDEITEVAKDENEITKDNKVEDITKAFVSDDSDIITENIIDEIKNAVEPVDDYYTETQNEIHEEIAESVVKAEEIKIADSSVSETKIFDTNQVLAYFGFASYILNDDAEEVLDYTVSKLKNNPDLNLIMLGHADQRGNPLFNFYLSQLRAHNAYNYCIDRGIDPDRIITLAHGQNNLAVTNARKEAEHRKNRRVEALLVDQNDFDQIAGNIRKESYKHLNNLNANNDFSDDVEYMVQFIASYVPVGTSFFNKILTEYEKNDIIYYYDNDKLHRYLIGSYSTVEDATNAALILHELGYKSYVVAFDNGERVSVSRALMLQGNAK